MSGKHPHGYMKAYREAHPDKFTYKAGSHLSHQAKRRAMLDELKNKPCMDCGGTFPPECMDFDHREGEVKLLRIGSQLRRKWESVLAEIAKCDLVCANCHRIRTKNRGYHNVPLEVR